MKSKTWLLTLGSFLIILIGGMFFAYPLLKKEKVLKVYQPADINPKLVDTSKQGVKKDHTIADFSLVNQRGENFTQSVFDDKIYVANFFFAFLFTFLLR